MIENGLSSRERQEGIYFAENLEDIKRILESDREKENTGTIYQSWKTDFSSYITVGCYGIGRDVSARSKIQRMKMHFNNRKHPQV